MAENLLSNSCLPSVSAKGLVSLVQCVFQFTFSDMVVLVIVMAEHLEHLWVICCVFVSEKPKRIDFFRIFMQNR